MLHVALRTAIIFTKFDVGRRIRSWLTTFLPIITYITLYAWPLTLSS